MAPHPEDDAGNSGEETDNGRRLRTVSWAMGGEEEGEEFRHLCHSQATYLFDNRLLLPISFILLLLFKIDSFICDCCIFLQIFWLCTLYSQYVNPLNITSSLALFLLLPFPPLLSSARSRLVAGSRTRWREIWRLTRRNAILTSPTVCYTNYISGWIEQYMASLRGVGSEQWPG